MHTHTYVTVYSVTIFHNHLTIYYNVNTTIPLDDAYCGYIEYLHNCCKSPSTWPGPGNSSTVPVSAS